MYVCIYNVFPLGHKRIPSASSAASCLGELSVSHLWQLGILFQLPDCFGEAHLHQGSGLLQGPNTKTGASMNYL